MPNHVRSRTCTPSSRSATSAASDSALGVERDEHAGDDQPEPGRSRCSIMHDADADQRPADRPARRRPPRGWRGSGRRGVAHRHALHDPPTVERVPRAAG